MVSSKLYLLEKDIATFLLDKLENKNMTIERAAEISRYVIKSLPDNLTDKQIDNILPGLDDKFVELTSLVHIHLLEYEEKNRQNLITEAEKLMHQKKINEANNLMKDYFNKKL